MSDQQDPKAVVIYQLEAFQNVKGQTITDDTIPADRLNRAKDKINKTSNLDLFKNVLKTTFKKKKMPDNWERLTVAELAKAFLMLLILVVLGGTVVAQPTLQIAGVKTNSKQSAIAFGIQYAQDIGQRLDTTDFFQSGKHSFLDFTPSIDVLYGDKDAFSSINLKATGTLALFSSTTVGGYQTPNTSKVFYLIPFSMGTEADASFQKINGIAEIGFAPYYYTNTINVPEALKHTRIGVYLQAGRKFYTDTSLDHAILRAKGSFTIDTKKLISLGGIGVGATGYADGWYDFLNAKRYYKVVGSANIYLTDRAQFDLFYQRGSGAPNFFEGSQYGFNLGYTF